MKLGCPVCGSKFTIAEARHEAAMKEMIELAASFGKNWGVIYDYSECFRTTYWGSVREQKRLRLLKEIRKLFETNEFEIDGKRYRTDWPRIISAIGAVVDADKIGFKNHNYLKRVLMGEKAEKLSAEGSVGNYTFYKSNDPAKRKGHRMKIRILPQWSPTLFEAQRALIDYAHKVGLEEL